MKSAFWALILFSVSLLIGVEMLSLSEDEQQISTYNSCSMDNNYWMCNERMPDNADLLQNFGRYTQNKRGIFEIYPNGKHERSKELVTKPSVYGNAYQYSTKSLKPIPCPKIFNPVCATFAEVKSTFINECLVNAENIKTGKNWKIHAHGICEEDFSVTIPRIRKRSVGTSTANRPYKWDNIESQLNLGDDVTYITAPSRFATQFISSQNHEEYMRNLNVNNPAPIQQQPHLNTENSFESHISPYHPSMPTAQPHQNLGNSFDSSPSHEEYMRNTPTPIQRLHKSPGDSIESHINTYHPSLTTAHSPPNYKNVLNDILDVLRNSHGQKQNVDNDFSIPKFSFQHPILPSLSRANFDSSGCRLGATPICARHAWQTETFENLCKLKFHNLRSGENWQIVHEGECKNCVLECPKILSPICASRNGIQYTLQNECLLKSLNCMSKHANWVFVKNGNCDGIKEHTIRDKYEFIKPGFRFTSNFKKPLETTIKKEEISTIAEPVVVTTTEIPVTKKITPQEVATTLTPTTNGNEDSTAITETTILS